ncbi:hypothetical protein [Streptomyces sp. NPDC060022]|uniref:hypothetical protein n=1 Tax=Streptomyces sp. NPDC060022 TaxID=3347039 RepID=UPI00368583E0
MAALRAEGNVSIALHKLGDYEAARAVNADLLPKLERAAGKDHSATEQTRSRLEMNLRALGGKEEADEVHGGIPNF